MLDHVEFEGTTLVVDTTAEIRPGDTYYTPGRNTGPKLFTCREHNIHTFCVFPKEIGYVFGTGECFKVIAIDDEQIAESGPTLMVDGENYFSENRLVYKIER